MKSRIKSIPLQVAVAAYVLLCSDALADHGIRLERVHRYNGPSDTIDIAGAIAIDSGRVFYVTGQSGIDFCTIKYDSAGDTVWTRRHPAIDARALAVDDHHDIYVAGGTWGLFATIKYASNGDVLWLRQYPDSTSSGIAYALAVDDSGSVHVTGSTELACEYGCVGNEKMTIKYTPDGDTVWYRTYSGAFAFDEEGRDIVVDAIGNVYVTGFSERLDSNLLSDIVTIKYTPSGDTSWIRRFNGPVDGDDYAYAIGLDSNGNVFAAGSSVGIGTSRDFVTIKYSPVGATLWTRRYNWPGSGIDVVNDLVLDPEGNVYVTGKASGDDITDNFGTIKYSPMGDTVWTRYYNGPADGFDVARAIALGGNGNIYVTGQSEGVGSSSDYATVVYSSDGDLLGVERYNGSGNGTDYAEALAIDDSGNVYVTGASFGATGNLDYVTLKYTPCAILAGDVNVNGVITSADIIELVNYVFKSGPPPLPCPASGDVNCDDNITSADIIYLVNHVFKGGPEGCDVCHNSALVSDC